MLTGLSTAQSWAPVINTPTNFNAGEAVLLTDGTVLIQAASFGSNLPDGTGEWYRLTPDAAGNYTDGTWTQVASMPAGYAPLWHATAVLPDGRVLVEGGEYNGSSAQAETSLGAIFDPVANTWTAVNPPYDPLNPSAWSRIGDAQSVVLPNGTLMLGNCCSSEQALFNASNLGWSILSNNGKADANTEEGWVLLPNGYVLTVDMSYDGGTYSQLFDPASDSWSATGSVGVNLEDQNCTETGPMVLRPDGTVLAIGGTGQTAIYNPSNGDWTNGPALGGGLGDDDGPGALLPNGNVLFIASPYGEQGLSGCYGAGSQAYESNGTTLTLDQPPTNYPSDPSFVYHMLVLPTGQVLVTDRTNLVEVFDPTGTYSSAWQPTISSAPASVTAGGSSYSISGTQFNGLSQGAMYGDDSQMASNFPLVRVTNDSTRHVFYCRTHNFSTMAVATGAATVSAEFDVPADIDAGDSTLEVVANGIPSEPVNIEVNVDGAGQSVTASPTSLNFRSSGGSSPTADATITNNGPGTLTIYGIWADGDYFSLHSTTCGATLAQGSSCTALVEFSPGDYCLSSPASGTLYFSDSGGQQQVALSGTTVRCLQ